MRLDRSQGSVSDFHTTSRSANLNAPNSSAGRPSQSDVSFQNDSGARARLNEDLKEKKKLREADAWQTWAEENQGRCINSDQCGSGYACIGTHCVRQTPSGSGGYGGNVSGDGGGGCAPPTFVDPVFPVFPCGGAPSGNKKTCGNNNCFWLMIIILKF